MYSVLLLSETELTCAPWALARKQLLAMPLPTDFVLVLLINVHAIYQYYYHVCACTESEINNSYSYIFLTVFQCNISTNQIYCNKTVKQVILLPGYFVYSPPLYSICLLLQLENYAARITNVI